MKKRIALTLSSAGALLTAGIALAGLLPDPPFANGGFNAPDATVLKQEQAVGKVITKYVGSRTKCDHKAVASLQKSHLAADLAGIAAAQTAWTTCVATGNTKYAAARDKLLLGGTPACLDMAGIDAIKTSLDASLLFLGPAVFCEATFGNDPVTALNVPGTAAFVKSEIAIAKAATKAGTGAGKCYTKAASTVFKNAGTLPAADLTKFNDCIAKASAGGTAAVAKLLAGGTLPGCLPAPTANFLITAAISLGGDYNDETYCQSPSGAFID